MPRQKKHNLPLFAQKLTELRKARQLTQAELSEQIGMARSVIGYYESAAKNPTVDTLIKFAEFFGVAPAYFLSADEDSPSKPSSRLDQQIERLKKLSPYKQRMISDILEAALNAK
jgi:transcriptional regulator with XRE-family HTH domain